jgi:hypothetical protein
VKKLTAIALSVASMVLVSAAVAAAPASASVFCQTAPVNHVCLAKYPDGTPFKATLSSPIMVHAGFTDVSCTSSSVEGTIKGETVTMSSVKIESCGESVSKIIRPNIWIFPWQEGTHNAAHGWGYTEWSISRFGTTCVYDYPEGISLIGGTSPEIKISGPMSKVSGGFLCANPAEVVATYKVTTPSPLYVEKE